jgi:hypothetical protein
VTTQLSLYNGALLLCKERFLSSLSEEREPRRLLDHVYSNGGVKFCLEQAQWHFAMRTVMVDYESSIEPDFGYRRAFTKPTDWVLTSAVCEDEFFNAPLTRYFDESGYWYSDLDTIYVRYVSNDTDYGMDLNKWPESFREFVEAHFASKIIGKLSGSEEKTEEMLKLRQKLMLIAKNKSAMADSTKFPAPGSWSMARSGQANKSRGNRGSLIG